MFADPVDQVAGLIYQLDDVNQHIDAALASGRRRDFKWWCKRRATLESRLQNLLIIVATH